MWGQALQVLDLPKLPQTISGRGETVPRPLHGAQPSDLRGDGLTSEDVTEGAGPQNSAYGETLVKIVFPGGRRAVRRAQTGACDKQG